MNLSKQFRYFVAVFVGLYLFWYLFYEHLYLFNQICAILFLSIISWTLGFYLYDKYNTETVSPENKAVLITGCDSGFGHILAQRLDKFGFHVHAGVLFPDGEGAKELERKCSNRLTIHKMDVTSQDDVQQVVSSIRKRALPLWAVVNNAGIAFGAPCDWGNDVDIFRKTFEVNLFGVVRVTKYCLPLIRQSGGRIVNVASVLGRVTTPTLSHYSMSKHSVRVFSNTLRLENLHHNFKVVTIEPTFYKTAIVNFDQINQTQKRIFDETPPENKLEYDDQYFRRLKEFEQTVKLISRPNLSEVTDAMMKAVTLLEPKLFYRCCGSCEVPVWAIGLLPECLLDSFNYFILYHKFGSGLLRKFLQLFELDKDK